MGKWLLTRAEGRYPLIMSPLDASLARFHFYPLGMSHFRTEPATRLYNYLDKWKAPPPVKWRGSFSLNLLHQIKTNISSIANPRTRVKPHTQFDLKAVKIYNYTMIGFIKKYLAKKDLYLKSPVILQKPLQRGKISVIEPYDLEVDRQRLTNEEAKLNSFIHPTEKE